MRFYLLAYYVKSFKLKFHFNLAFVYRFENVKSFLEVSKNEITHNECIFNKNGYQYRLLFSWRKIFQDRNRFMHSTGQHTNLLCVCMLINLLINFSFGIYFANYRIEIAYKNLNVVRWSNSHAFSQEL